MASQSSWEIIETSRSMYGFLFARATRRLCSPSAFHLCLCASREVGSVQSELTRDPLNEVFSGISCFFIGGNGAFSCKINPAHEHKQNCLETFLKANLSEIHQTLSHALQRKMMKLTLTLHI